MSQNGVAGNKPAPGKPSVWHKRPWVPWALIALALLMFVALAFTLLAVVQIEKIPNELSLPVLAIAGVVALLGSLALVSVSFNLVNMSDKTQALGLPQGSVRAVIALSLVVLFAILTVYLFGSLNASGKYDQIGSCLDSASANAIVGERHPNDPSIFLLPVSTSAACGAVSNQDVSANSAAPPANAETPPSSAGTPAASTNASLANSVSPTDKGSRPPPVARFDVFVERSANPAGIDFAKQLLVLIGTLVTSVASFYFGSKAVGEARDAMAGLNVLPALQGVEPATLPKGIPEQTLDVLGTGLNGVRQVQVSRGPDQINALSVTSNDNRVHAKFNVPETTDLNGPAWDVTVTDGQGRTARLPAVVTIVEPKTDAKTQEPAPGRDKPVDEKSGPVAPATATLLTDVAAKLKAEKTAADVLQSANTGAALPSLPAATQAELSQWLSIADTLAKGPADPAAIGAAVQTGTALLATVQNAGLPGALADVLAVLQRLSSVAIPAALGIPAGPVGIVLGVLSGLIALGTEQQKLNAAKAALLNTPFDPSIPLSMPTRDTALVAIKGTAFDGASADQALTIMEAALARRDGQFVPTDEVATTLLANPVTVGLLQQFATPTLRAQAIEQLRGDALFLQARDLLAKVPDADTPAAAGLPAGKVDLPALLDWLQARRTDPQVAAAIDKLVGIADLLLKLPGDKQQILSQLAAFLETASSLAQSGRQG